MVDLKDVILKTRPELSSSSVKTYASLLTNLYKYITKRVGDPQEIVELFETEPQRVLDFLLDAYPFKTRKTKLASILAVCQNPESRAMYSKEMLRNIESYNDEMNQQEKTDKETKQWKTQAEISQIYSNLKKNIKWSKNHKNQLQDYVIASLYVLIPPRRLLDYISFKIKNISTEKDNFLEKNNFVFNQFKTAKTYNQQKVAIPSSLKTIIQKWIRLNPEQEYLLVDGKGKALTAPALNRILNRIFGASVNMLRHSFVTEKVQMPKLTELDNIAEQMGTSNNTMIKVYKKF